MEHGREERRGEEIIKGSCLWSGVERSGVELDVENSLTADTLNECGGAGGEDWKSCGYLWILQTSRSLLTVLYIPR